MFAECDDMVTYTRLVVLFAGRCQSPDRISDRVVGINELRASVLRICNEADRGALRQAQ